MCSSDLFFSQLALPVAGMIGVVLGGNYLHLNGRITFLLPLLMSGLVYLVISYFSPIRNSLVGTKES